MTSRGEYRAIHTVLQDGPDFQRLSVNARLCLLILKFSLGASGIDVLYPAMLEPRTGLAAPQVAAALDELRTADWVRTEGSVMWLVRGLKFEPTLSPLDLKHRSGVAKHLATLPSVSLIDAFRAYYSEWFVEAPSEPLPSPSKGPAKPLKKEGPSKGLRPPSDVVVSREVKGISTSAHAHASTPSALASRGGSGVLGSGPGERAVPAAPPVSAAEHAVTMRRCADPAWWGNVCRGAMAAGVAADDLTAFAAQHLSEPELRAAS